MGLFQVFLLTIRKALTQISQVWLASQTNTYTISVGILKLLTLFIFPFLISPAYFWLYWSIVKFGQSRFLVD